MPGQVVIADTSPLRYLVLIDEVSLLQKLYGRVLIPKAVAGELQREQTPSVVRAWMHVLPGWIEVCPDIIEGDREPVIASLGEGETQAIRLALSLHADLLLMDERAGIHEARRLGLSAVGTLGVLALAAERGLIDFEQVIRKLGQTNFRAHPKLIDEMTKTFRRS